MAPRFDVYVHRNFDTGIAMLDIRDAGGETIAEVPISLSFIENILRPPSFAARDAMVRMTRPIPREKLVVSEEVE